MYLNVRFRGLLENLFFFLFCSFHLFIYSLGATGVHCELNSKGLDIPSFIDFYQRHPIGDAFKLVTFGAGAKIATRLKSV